MLRVSRGRDKILPYWLSGEKSIKDTLATRDFVANGLSNWLSSHGMIAASKEVSVALVFHPAGLGSLKQLHRLRWPTISLPYPCRGVVSTMQHLAAVRANIQAIGDVTVSSLGGQICGRPIGDIRGHKCCSAYSESVGLKKSEAKRSAPVPRCFIVPPLRSSYSLP